MTVGCKIGKQTEERRSERGEVTRGREHEGRRQTVDSELVGRDTGVQIGRFRCQKRAL